MVLRLALLLRIRERVRISTRRSATLSEARGFPLSLQVNAGTVLAMTASFRILSDSLFIDAI
jgi:hypothetical protein